MNEMTKPEAAGPGHNNPPLWDEEKRAELEKKARDLADAAGAWKEAGEIKTAEQAEKANDFLAQGRKLFKTIEDTRKTEKEPHLQAGRDVDSAFALLKDIVEKAATKVKPLVEAFLKEQQKIADQKRREAEAKARAEAEAAEAARKAAEARNDAVGEAEAEAAAKEAEKAAQDAEKASKARVGSATGAGKTASLRTVKTPIIINELAAMRHYRGHADMRDLLLRLAAAEIRGGADLVPGFEIKVEKKL